MKALAGREGAGKEGERLAELREQAKTGTLKPDVHALEGEKNDAAAAQKAGELGQRFGKLAEGLNAEQRRMLQSHIEALTDLLARTRKLEQQAGEKGAAGKDCKGENKTPGADGKQEGANAKQPGNATEGDPAKQAGEKGANGKNGKGEGKEQRADGKPEGTKGQQKGEGKPEGPGGKQPGDTQQAGAGEKPADAKSENKEKEGTEAANNRNENTTQPAGEKAGTGPQPGRLDGARSAGGGGSQKALGPYGGIRDIDPIRNEYPQGSRPGGR